jgi:hypothetical protein
MDASNVNEAIGAIKHLRLPDFILPYRELPAGAVAAIEKLIDAFVSADETEKRRIVQRIQPSFAFVFDRYARTVRPRSRLGGMTPNS